MTEPTPPAGRRGGPLVTAATRLGRPFSDQLRQVDEHIGTRLTAVEQELAELIRSMTELRRIVQDHGDALSDVMEVVGRMLDRLGGEVATLRSALGRAGEAVEALPLQPPG